MNNLKESIQNFAHNDLLSQSLVFFQTLGYTSERRILNVTEAPEEFLKNYDGQNRFNRERGLLTEWQSIYLLFQLTDDEIKPTKPAFGRDAKFCVSTDNAIIESFLFIALELKESHYSRTELAAITRAINEIFSMPTILLFKYGDSLTLSVIHRRLHQRDESKDVLEKVTILKDINMIDPRDDQIGILEKLSLTTLNVSHIAELYQKWLAVMMSLECFLAFKDTTALADLDTSIFSQARKVVIYIDQ